MIDTAPPAGPSEAAARLERAQDRAWKRDPHRLALRLPEDPRSREVAGMPERSTDLNALTAGHIRREELVVQSLRHALRVLRDTVEINRKKRGGVPVLHGTRVPIAQVFAEVAEDARISELSRELDLDVDLVRRFFEGVALYFERPFF